VYALDITRGNFSAPGATPDVDYALNRQVLMYEEYWPPDWRTLHAQRLS
jgi:hypothetical protein